MFSTRWNSLDRRRFLVMMKAGVTKQLRVSQLVSRKASIFLFSIVRVVFDFWFSPSTVSAFRVCLWWKMPWYIFLYMLNVLWNVSCRMWILCESKFGLCVASFLVLLRVMTIWTRFFVSFCLRVISYYTSWSHHAPTVPAYDLCRGVSICASIRSLTPSLGL